MKNKRAYIVNNYEEVYANEVSGLEEDKAAWFESLRDAGVKGFREKIIRSGNYLEVEINPVFKKSVSARVKAAMATKPAQQVVNDRNRIKHIVRLMNENFTEKDISITLTYDDVNLPETQEAAMKNVRNYIRRVKTFLQKQGLGELKYILVTETKDEEGKLVRIHHHLVMNFQNRDKAEEMWKFGKYNNSKRLQANEFGFEAMGTYIAKQKKDLKYKKSFSTSQNLKKYDVKVRDNKITKRRVTKLFREEIDPREFFESQFKKYIFTDMGKKTSNVIEGCYLHVRMRSKSIYDKSKGRNIGHEK